MIQTSPDAEASYPRHHFKIEAPDLSTGRRNLYEPL